jgi:electron-transferring-flavoprotein dehydrogenase
MLELYNSPPGERQTAEHLGAERVMDAGVERERMEYDVVIVGAGPSGLATAIRLKQRAAASGTEVSVAVIEKGSEVGAHILSGAVLEPRALNELIPDWRERGAPVATAVAADEFRLFTAHSSLRLPGWLLPPELHNHGNFIISLGNLCRWLAEVAEGLGVEVFPGFAAADLVFDGEGRVGGVVTGDMGRGRDGEPTAGFQPGVELRAKYTVIAEGARGSLARTLFERFDLRRDCDPQTFGLGVKELWEVPAERHRPGLVAHGFGWPLDRETYGGSFIYHWGENLVSVGFVVGLDYRNPYLSPFEEFQRFKTHPDVRETFSGARRIAYGARAINEGGLQSVPRLVFPGGLIVGCSAGFVNVPKIKGTHTAMKSGMLAADALLEALAAGRGGGDELEAYPAALAASWVAAELKAVRNCRPAYRWGLAAGTFMSGLELWLRGRTPWTLRHRHGDHESLRRASASRPIDYPRPDGVLTFDRLSSVYLSNTNHEENQPCHLRLKDPSIPIAHNLPLFDEPAQRYCPAAVYEVVRDAGGEPRFVINPQNCVHCKTCDIKDPTQNIVWTVPEGGGGPNYPNM